MVGPNNDQIYKGDPRTCVIFIPAWGSNWGSLGFSRNQNNRGSWGGYVTCIYCSLSVKINPQNIARHAKIVNIFVLCLILCVCVVGKNPKTPNLSPMTDDVITRGGIRGLGSPLYICEHHKTTKLRDIIQPTYHIILTTKRCQCFRA